MPAPGTVGVHAVGAYVPRRRVPREVIANAHAWAVPALQGLAKGQRSLGNWDEDAITMAVEAARPCLAQLGDVEPGHVTFASTTAPFASLQNAAIVSSALGLDGKVRNTDCGGTPRAGLSALIRACEQQAVTELIIASDRRAARPGSVQELQYGHAAAAAVVGPGGSPLARFLGAESVAQVFVDHFRERREAYDYYWEERWIRDEGVLKIVPDAVAALLKGIGCEPADVKHFSLCGAPSRADRAAAKAVGIGADAVLPDQAAGIGDSGAAHAILQLCAALERAEPGDVVVLASFGQGCEVAAFEALRRPPSRSLEAALARGVEERAYMRMLSFEGILDPDWGMRAETDTKTALSQLHRAADQILPFSGGQCPSCNAVQFPRMPTCVACGAIATQAPYPLRDEPARLVTCTADWLQYCPAPPLRIGLVQFDCGARVLMEVVDAAEDAAAVGTPLRMCFRIKERDRTRHFNRYFWKATPITTGGRS